VVIVSRSLAEHYWPGHSPLGRRLKLARYAAAAPWLTIVGVAADVRHGTLAAPSRQVVYYPAAQVPSAGMELVVRTVADDAGLVSAVRSTISRTDPDLPVDSIRPMTDLVRSSLLDHELEFAVLGAFAVIAVVLAAAGIYGVMTYTMAQRAQEFGVRLALGASSKDIVRLVTVHAIRLTGTGTLIGIGAAWFSARALGDLLYGVAPADPTVFACAATLLATSTLVACVAPTLSALRADPLTSLRSQ
jgi:putative ABC transport system permease protein